MAEYTAIIIEPRRHPALQFVLKNALENLSDEWGIIVFHGLKNIKFVKDILKTLKQYSNRISLVKLHVSNLTKPKYSKLLVSRDFYKHIPTEIFLIFQTDSIIFCTNKHKINQFLHYDYVGAPWKDGVGNGGLSLRRKSKMLSIIDSFPYNKEPEDLFFACRDPTVYTPSIEKAKEFSVEHLYHPASFGSHQAWIFHPKLMATYPELKILMDLQ